MTNSELLVSIVDDDPILLKNLREALEDAGYAVTSVDSGHGAMGLLESSGHDFRVLITDVNLPGEFDGWAIAHRAREINPTLPVIYMSGAAAHEWSANGVPESVLLTKPFALVQAVTAVAQLMNSASSSLPASKT